MAKIKIFISSVQKEFSSQRRLLYNYITTDSLLSKFFDVFIFENVSAQDEDAESLYLEVVKSSDIYLGILGKEYGYEFEDGLSPTEKEFNCATEHHKYRIIFLSDTPNRHSKVERFIHKIKNILTYKTFVYDSELIGDAYSSLIEYLNKTGKIRIEPFDRSIANEAELDDISDEKINWFISRAREERALPLSVETTKEKLLTHLNLFNNGKLTNSAILLFGKMPQKFFISSEVKCAHFHGLTVQKPIPFYQVYKGNLFDLVDQTVNFVLSKIDFAIGTREKSAQVPTSYEIPPAVIEEAIVNAIVHRDYDSNASVQVMIFADRIEIRNPGSLPPGLTIEKLKKDHSSYPKNPLLAESMYLTKYIEKMGTGVMDMILRCNEFGLKEPEFKSDDDFVCTIFRKKHIAFTQINSGQIGGQIGGQMGGQIGSQISEIQKEILNQIALDQKVSRKQLSLLLKINESAIQKHLYKLKERKLLIRKGKTRGYWIINLPKT